MKEEKRKKVYDYLEGFIFPTLLCSPAPCKNSKITPGPENKIRTILLAFPKTKSGQKRYAIFVSFFDVKGLCWPLYKPHISYNAIAGVIWTVNNDHDKTDTPKKLPKKLIFFEENVRNEVKWRMKEIVEDPSIFIALNKSKVISSVNKNIF
jgi:hypothetical protein